MRAGVARVLGSLKYAPARKDLEFLLEDKHWLVRAEAAWALGQIGNEESLSLLIRGLEDSSPKAWIVFADAVASFGRPDERATQSLIPRLKSRHWQVRVTACQALARVGTEAAVGPLIERFNREGGRLYRELKAALIAVTQDDLGPNPKTWLTWWEKQQEEHGGLGPMPEKRADPGRPLREPGTPGARTTPPTTDVRSGRRRSASCSTRAARWTRRSWSRRGPRRSSAASPRAVPASTSPSRSCATP